MDNAAVVEDLLEHHGVKGMHWGVRRDRSSGGGSSKTKTALKTFGKDVGFEIATNSKNEYLYSRLRMSIAKSADAKFQNDLPAIKAKHGASAELRTRIKSPLSKESHAYRADVRDAYLKRLEEAANEQVNASGTRQRTLSTTNLGISKTGPGRLSFSIVEKENPNTHKYIWQVRTRPIQHADQLFLTVEPIFDGDGFITGVKPVSDSMTQSDLFVGEFLEHHGVKGMHWGVRKDRGGSGGARPVEVKTRTLPTGKTVVTTKGGSHHPAHSDAVAAKVIQQKLKKSGSDSLSNEELRRFNERQNLELQAKRNVPASNLHVARKYTAAVLKTPEGQQTVSAVASKAGKHAHLIRGAAKVAAVLA